MPGEIPGLLERLAEVPGPRDPRGVRHALVVMLALTTCAVLAGATSLLAAGELATLNGYAATAARQHLPALAAVDVAMTEPSPQAARDYLAKAGPFDYPVGVDATGQVADGYGVQDQPWLALVDRTGKITWSNRLAPAPRPHQGSPGPLLTTRRHAATRRPAMSG